MQEKRHDCVVEMRLCFFSVKVGDYKVSLVALTMCRSTFTADGENVKVSVAVKFIDNQTKATQVSQYELTLHKDSNWKIIG